MQAPTAPASWASEIRDAREEAGLTQADLARRAGTDQGTVSNAEAGRVGAGMYLRLAAALGISLVFDPETQPEPEQ